MAIFGLHYHKSKLIFHGHAVDMKIFYEFTNSNSKQIAKFM